ncbi:TPA: ABC transporter ATP-binding protein [bacterium]|nr:ABC transporter ATP-binding protein [bacterium]
MIFGRHINKYYLKYLHFFLLGLIALLVVDYFQLLIPEYSGDIIDLLEQGKMTREIIVEYVIKIGLIAIIIVIGRFTWRYSIFGTSRKIEHDIRNQMFQHALKLDQTFYNDNKVGGLMAYFTNDLEMIRQAFGHGFLIVVDASFLGVLAFYKMTQLDLRLSLISIIPLFLIASYGFIIGRIIRPKFRRMQEVYERMSDFTNENFSGISVIKAFVKQEIEFREFCKINEEYKQKNIDFVKVSTLMHIIIGATITLMIIFIISYGSYLVINTRGLEEDLRFTIGHLSQFISYFTSLIWPMMAIGQFITMRSQAMASLTRINNYLNEEIRVNDNKADYSIDKIEGKIEFKNLSFTYPKDKHPVLKDINFTINKGEMVGIIGRTGCGKTTLVDLIMRIYNVDEDSLFLDDHDIMKLPLSVVRTNIAIVPQDTYLFSKTVKENIGFALDRVPSLDEVIKYAKQADIHENVMEFEDKYDTLLGERGVTVSGGQKQRISIARALIKESNILILDNSVSAVDTKTEEIILNQLRETRKGRTTIIIAHRVSTIKDLDKIAVMDDGRIIDVGSHNELLNRCELYQDIVTRQKLEEEIGEV